MQLLLLNLLLLQELLLLNLLLLLELLKLLLVDVVLMLLGKRWCLLLKQR